MCSSSLAGGKSTILFQVGNSSAARWLHLVWMCALEWDWTGDYSFDILRNLCIRFHNNCLIFHEPYANVPLFLHWSFISLIFWFFFHMHVYIRTNTYKSENNSKDLVLSCHLIGFKDSNSSLQGWARVSIIWTPLKAPSFPLRQQPVSLWWNSLSSLFLHFSNDCRTFAIMNFTIIAVVCTLGSIVFCIFKDTPEVILPVLDFTCSFS